MHAHRSPRFLTLVLLLASASPHAVGTAYAAAATAQVPYVIVTDASLAAEFAPLASAHTAAGLPAEVHTLQEIQAAYPVARDDAERIRMFLIDAHAQRGARFVLLGGDEPLIPMRRALDRALPTATSPPDSLLPTDQYYACLAGDWNADGDAWWGELPDPNLGPGDAPSFVPDLAVGRAPVLTAADARRFVQKTLAALTLAVPAPHELLEAGVTRFLDLGSIAEYLILPGLAAMPGGSVSRLYANAAAFSGAALATPQSLLDSLGAGPDLAVLADPGGIGALQIVDVPQQLVTAAQLGAIANARPLHVLALSAFTNTPGTASVATAMMLDPLGGATTFVGPTSIELTTGSAQFIRRILDAMYTSGAPTIGEALDAAINATNGGTLTDITRLATQGNVLYGDPAMPPPGGVGAPVPVAVSLVSADATPGHVALVWYAVDAPRATVERSRDGMAWRVLGGITADGEGFLRVVDPDVTPGARYGYRLRIADGTGERIAGEAWVTVPRAELALAGARPDPARGAIAIAFTLPDAGAARLELFDTLGRRLRSRAVGGLGAGEHLVELSEGRMPAPGVYFVRLVHAGRTLVTRVAVMR